MNTFSFTPSTEVYPHVYETPWRRTPLQTTKDRVTKKRLVLRSKMPLSLERPLTEHELNRLRQQGVIISTNFQDFSH